MKQYPSIRGPCRAPLNEPCIAFYKYDGSNLRFEWNAKRGFYKFGTRRRLFDKTDSEYEEAIDLFLTTQAIELEKIFKKEYRARQAIVFCEFFGAQSFAGKHKEKDPKQLVLIDINIDKKGFISPADFVSIFGHFPFCASVIYRGPLTEEFVQNVRENNFDLNEGVVCKGGKGHKLWRCKIKTNDYRVRLIEVYKDGWAKYWEE